MAIKLTDEQLAIIHTKKRHVYVEAVAGSGKTATLCHRVHHLIKNGVSPDEILILSFSNHSVNVLQNRLNGIVPSESIRTFHAFGNYLVRQAAGQKFEVASPKIGESMLRQAAKNLPNERKKLLRRINVDLKASAELKRLLTFINTTKGNRELKRRIHADPSNEFSDYAQVEESVSLISKYYRKVMRENGLIDYVEMLKQGRKVLEQRNLIYTHVLIDEVQDMDSGQAGLLSAISKQARSVMIFGDPRQAIYGFMGAQRYEEDDLFQKMTKFPLSRSFRLTHQSASLANAIFDEEFVCGIREGKKPSLRKCETTIEMEDDVVDLINRLTRNGVKENQIAILSRTKAPLRSVEQALRQAGFNSSPRYTGESHEHLDRMLRLLSLLEKYLDRLRSQALTNKQKRKLENRISKVSEVSVSSDVLSKIRRGFVKAAQHPTFSGRYCTIGSLYVSLVRSYTPSEKKLAEIEINRWQAIADIHKSVTPLRAYITNLKAKPTIT